VGAGGVGALPLDSRQTQEVLLTAAQSLFGVAILMSLSLELVEAALLAGLFLAQLVLGGVFRAGLHSDAAGSTELLVFSAIYVVLALALLFRARRTLVALVRRGPSATIESLEVADLERSPRRAA